MTIVPNRSIIREKCNGDLGGLMPALKIAITVVEYVIAFIGVMLLGDYLGHKFGRRQLATTSGLIALGVVIAFAITAAILLIRV